MSRSYNIRHMYYIIGNFYEYFCSWNLVKEYIEERVDTNQIPDWETDNETSSQ